MYKRFCCFSLSLLLAVSCLSAPLTSLAAKSSDTATELNEETSAIIESFDTDSESNSYYDYYNYYASEKMHTGYVTVKGTDFVKSEKSKTGTYDGVKAAVLDSTNEWVEYKVTVPETAKYGITLYYYQLPHKEKDIEVTVKIDGKLPYTEARQITVPRLWKDSIDSANVPKTDGALFECADENGNADDVRPSQVENKTWTSRELMDLRGLYDEQYQFYLTQGTHTVRINLEREAIAISKIKFGNKKDTVSYEEFISNYTDADYVKDNGNGDLVVKTQAEDTLYKNNIILYPTYDKSGASTEPASPAYTKLNTIGQDNWSTNGDEIVWNLNAKQAGLYKFTMRVRQNYSVGMYSYRTLKVNGKVPYKEAEAIKFKYQQSWYMLTLGDDTQDFYIYLNKGDNTVSLTCTTGEMSQVLRNVQQSVLLLNSTYREIIAVTSTSPDIYRDYGLEAQIPTLVSELKYEKEFLTETAALVKDITGTDGSSASSINYVLQIISDFADDTEEIPERLSTFKDAIETLGSLVSTLSKLALEIDYIEALPVDAEIPSAGKGFFNSAAFTWNQLISSFTVDYNSTSDQKVVTGDDVQTINVWVNTGRDQAKIINRLVSDAGENLVTSDGKRIAVKLSLVDTGQTLIKATLAGKGPDCALMIGEDTPMNLAARKALLPLTDYKKDIEDQFHSCAWTPFYYDGEYYALPETQAFDVAFYRTDVFEEMGINAPTTWEEFYTNLEILQSDNLLIGIPEVNSANAGVSSGIGTFDKFLVQNGGTYYTDNLDATRFNEEVAYSAFEEWVELYTKYGLERSFDFYSRFRTGEMPYSIQSYTAYNQLKTAAPELNGLWSIAPIPGTVQADGTIDNSETSTVTGCILLRTAKEHYVDEVASLFLQWWVSADTQAEYARELEATLGVAARYNPANVEAFDSLGWTSDEAAILKGQWDKVIVMNEIPGNYVLKRSLTSAFRTVISGKNAARRSLTIYNKSINDEIKRKRTEFGLE